MTESKAQHQKRVDYDDDGDDADDVQNEMVRKLRADAASRKFADDGGRFRQIFPPRERSQLDKYAKLLETACSFYEPSLETERQQEVQRFLVQKVRKIYQLAGVKDWMGTHGNAVPRPPFLQSGVPRPLERFFRGNACSQAGIIVLSIGTQFPVN